MPPKDEPGNGNDADGQRTRESVLAVLKERRWKSSEGVVVLLANDVAFLASPLGQGDSRVEYDNCKAHTKRTHKKVCKFLGNVELYEDPGQLSGKKAKCIKYQEVVDQLRGKDEDELKRKWNGADS